MPHVCSGEASNSSITTGSSSRVLGESTQEPGNKSKRVGFTNIDRVILVPTRQEYIDHKLGDKLWWTAEDYHLFKRSAILEVSAIINIYRVDAKTALSKLCLEETNDDFSEDKPDAADAASNEAATAAISLLVGGVSPLKTGEHKAPSSELNALPSSPKAAVASSAAKKSLEPLHPLAYMVC
jgi:hypothetical protein